MLKHKRNPNRAYLRFRVLIRVDRVMETGGAAGAALAIGNLAGLWWGMLVACLCVITAAELIYDGKKLWTPKSGHQEIDARSQMPAMVQDCYFLPLPRRPRPVRRARAALAARAQRRRVERLQAERREVLGLEEPPE